LPLGIAKPARYALLAVYPKRKLAFVMQSAKPNSLLAPLISILLPTYFAENLNPTIRKFTW